MAELPERDAASLLDMLLAARDAQSFIEGLDELAFLKIVRVQNDDVYMHINDVLDMILMGLEGRL